MTTEHDPQGIARLLSDTAVQPRRRVDPAAIRRRVRRRRQVLAASAAGAVVFIVGIGAGLFAGIIEQPVPLVTAPDEGGGSSAGEPPQEANEAKQGSTSQSEIEERDIAEEEIEAVREYHGLSSEQAEQRIRLEEAMHGLDERLEARWPNSYAGAVLPTGALTVEVRFTGEVEDPARRRSEIADEFAYPEHVEIHDGYEHSLATARDVYEELAEDLERLHRTGEHPLEVVREINGEGLGVGLTANEVTLTVAESTRQELADADDPEGTQRLLRAVREYYGFDSIGVDPIEDPQNNPGTTD